MLMLKLRSPLSDDAMSLENENFQTFRYASLILAIVLDTIGLLVLLSLVSELAGVQVVGRLGTLIALTLNYIFGTVLSLLIPFLFLGLGVLVLQRRHPHRLPFLVEGGFMAIVCMAALLSINVANGDPHICIKQAGAIGTFLMHNSMCNLKGFLGTIGSYLTFLSLLLISIILMLNRNPLVVFSTCVRKIRDGSFKRWLENQFTEEVEEDVDEYDEYEEYDEDGDTFTVYIGNEEDGNNKIKNRMFSNVADTSDTDDEQENNEDNDKVVPMTIEMTPLPKPNTDDTFARTKKTMRRKPSLPIIDVYNLPETDLLKAPPRVNNKANDAEAHARARAIVDTLASFDVPVAIANIVMGPAVTCYEIQPAAGVKVEKITNLENNLAMAM